MSRTSEGHAPARTRSEVGVERQISAHRWAEQLAHSLDKLLSTRNPFTISLTVLLWLIAALLSARYVNVIAANHVTADPLLRHTWFGIDIRGALWQPVRDLFHGHNPYDAPAYVARYPGTAEFDLYAPSWLLVSAPIAALPLTGAIVLSSCLAQVMNVVVAVTTCRIAKLPKLPWVLPGLLVLILHMNPQLVGQHGLNPSFIVAPLAAIALWRTDDDWITALALAGALLKPQYGLPITAAILASGRWRAVIKGWCVTLGLSIVPLAMAIHAAGGPIQFVQSLGRNLDYALTSPVNGVLGPTLNRTDAAGIIGHLDQSYLPSAPSFLLAATFTAIACWAYWRYREQSWASRVRRFSIAAIAVLFAFPHDGRYDFIFVVPALAATMHLAMRPQGRILDRAAGAVVFSLALITLIPPRFLREVHIDQGTTTVLLTAGMLLVTAIVLVADDVTLRRSVESPHDRAGAIGVTA